MTVAPAISVIMVIDRPLAEVECLLRSYREELTRIGQSFEFVCVLDGGQPDVGAVLQHLSSKGEPIKVLQFDRASGESAALNVAVRYSSGQILLTLPAYTRVAAAEIPGLLAALDTADMVIGRRDPRIESPFGRLKARVLNTLLRWLLGNPFRDLGSGVRALRRAVLEDLTIYGEQYLFLPLIAAERGFVVHELTINQATTHPRPGLRLGRLLDIFAIYFILRFTRRPFRFFGGIGLAILLFGCVVTGYLVVERLFFGVALGDRPALVLSTLMIVLGFQIIAVGLIGEIIAFGHAREFQDYKVARIFGGEDIFGGGDVSGPDAHEFGSARMATVESEQPEHEVIATDAGR